MTRCRNQENISGEGSRKVQKKSVRPEIPPEPNTDKPELAEIGSNLKEMTKDELIQRVIALEGQVKAIKNAKAVSRSSALASARARERSGESGEGLGQTLKRFYHMFSEMYSGLLLMTDDGRVEYANQAFCNYYGLKEAPKDLVGMASSDLLEKIKYAYLRPDEAADQVREILKRGRPVRLEEFAMADGGTAVRDFVPLSVEGKPCGRFWIHTDITQRKQMEEGLRESENKLRLFIEHAPAAIAMFDTSMRYLAVSRRWLSDYNLGQQDIIGRSHYEIFPEISDRWKEIHKRCLAGATEMCDEEPFPRLDGRLDWVKWEIHPWYDEPGRIGGLIMFTEVITERKRMQEALQKSHDQLERRVAERTAELRDSHERFRSLVELLPEMVFEVDTTGKYTYANRQALEVFGLTLDELQRRHIRDIVTERDYSRVMENFKTVLRGEPNRGAECMVTQKDGTEFPVFIRASRIERNGKIEGLRGIVIDLTESKKVEAEKGALQEQVHRAQKMDAIGTLAGGIAHDFNNMLAVILGNAELALDDISPEGPRQNIEQIIAASKRSRDLVRQILTFSRKSEGARTFFNLAPMIEETAKLLRGSLPSTINMKIDIRTSSDTVSGNATQIEQILMNLATNAAHAIGEDGGTLAIRLTEKMFAEGEPLPDPDMRAGRYLKLTVRDTGTGIPREIRSKIFDPFFTTKEPGQGTGMGLSVVYGVVKSHRGAVTVRSKMGKGSIFSVFFPMASSVVEQKSRPSAPMPTGRERILVVDDEPYVLEVLSGLLKRLGYRVDVARSAAEGWKIFQRSPDAFDLIITDHVMPRTTGMRLAERMLQKRADLPIIIASGYSELLTPDKLEAIGISQFLMKPIEAETLAATVRRALLQKVPEKRTPFRNTT